MMYFWSRQTQLIPSYDVLPRLMRVTKLNYFPRMMSSRGLMNFLLFLSFDDLPRVNRRFFDVANWNNGLPKPQLIPSYDVLLGWWGWQDSIISLVWCPPEVWCIFLYFSRLMIFREWIGDFFDVAVEKKIRIKMG